LSFRRDEETNVQGKRRTRAETCSPTGSGQFYAEGDRLLVFREEPEGFAGPFQVEHVDKKPIHMLDGNHTKAFSRSQIKPYREITHHREAATEVVPKISSTVEQDFQTTYATEVLSRNYQRANDPMMNQAKNGDKGATRTGSFQANTKK
jgi:hypothetical protein